MLYTYSDRACMFVIFSGAMKSTVADIWRMIWSHDIAIIVMLTGCYEHGRVSTCNHCATRTLETLATFNEHVALMGMAKITVK